MKDGRLHKSPIISLAGLINGAEDPSEAGSSLLARAWWAGRRVEEMGKEVPGETAARLSPCPTSGAAAIQEAVGGVASLEWWWLLLQKSKVEIVLSSPAPKTYASGINPYEYITRPGY